MLEQFAALLDYPDEQTAPRLETCLTRLRDWLPEAEEQMADWRDTLRAQPVWAAQELYTHTFDINPVCSLDVGYYLFGEDYQRGLFLAKLRESQEEVGMTGEVELPDHLPVVLRWLARVYGSELHTDMVADCLLFVLRQIDAALAGYPPGGGSRENPYRGVLRALSHILERDLEERGVTPAIPLPESPGRQANGLSRVNPLARPVDADGLRVLSPLADGCTGCGAMGAGGALPAFSDTDTPRAGYPGYPAKLGDG
jgi:nitrate reductase delta subunit